MYTLTYAYSAIYGRSMKPRHNPPYVYPLWWALIGYARTTR